MRQLFQLRDRRVPPDLVSMEMLLAFHLGQIRLVLPHRCAAEDVVRVVHLLVVSRQHHQFFQVWVHQDADGTCLGQMKMDCCQVLPLVEEYPFPELMRMDYCQVLEFQLTETVKVQRLRQVFQSLVQA
jgi:hypothetical protein